MSLDLSARLGEGAGERRREEPIQPINAVYEYKIFINAVSYNTGAAKLQVVVTKQELLRLAASFHRVVEGN